MYTSGTTGRAKGATLTHGNITWNAINVVVDADFRADEVALAVAPLFHTAALNMLCLPTMLKGGAVLIEPAFDPARVLELIARYRVTSMFGVPAIYDAMAASPGWADADTSSLRMLLCGGAPVPDATIRRYTSRGLTFIQGYGMTETSPGRCCWTRSTPWPRPGRPGCRTSSPTSGWSGRTGPRPGPASGARSSWPART